jgi:multiple sugar transport system substrate-binding protein
MKGLPLKVAIAVLLAALLVGACAPAPTPTPTPKPVVPVPTPTVTPKPVAPTPTPKPVVLKFPSWQQDEAGLADWWKALIAEFQKSHPNVTIEFTKVGREVFADTLITQFAAGSPPEITHLAAFEFPQFADQGWLEDIGPLLAKLGVTSNNWTGQGSCVWKGVTQCLMLNYFGMAMVVNEKLFKDAGVKVPTTYDEYIAAAKALTKDVDKDGTIDQYGIAFHTTGGSTEMSNIYAFLLSAGGGFTDKDGKVIINTPQGIEGLRRWKEVLKSGATPLNADSGKIRQLMMEGKVAMMIDGPWIWGFVKQAKEDVRPYLKVVPLPWKPPLGGESNVIAIPKGIPAEKKKLVEEFIALITQPEWQEKYAIAIGAPAPRVGSVTAKVREVSPYADIFEAAMKEAAAAGVSRTPKGLEVQVNEFAKYLHEESQAMLIKDKSPADSARDLQRIAEELQKRK